MASVNSNGPDKCTIKFGAKNINYDTLRKKENILVDETNDANLRYVGANPSNYIWFNCLKYDDLNNENAEDEQHKCERWRIIGLMNDMTIVNEKTGEETTNQSLVKIIRSNNIGQYSFDNKDLTIGVGVDNGINDYSQAELMYLLNPNNEEHTLNGVKANNSLYWNSDKGLCSNAKSMATTTCDFTNIGLKDGTTKQMIENVKWLTGAVASNIEVVSKYYLEERGNTTCYTLGRCPVERALYWNGKVALFYISDYGYATSGGDMPREKCLKKELYNWYEEDSRVSCAENDWLRRTNSYDWSLSMFQINGAIMRSIGDATSHFVDGSGAYPPRSVVPTLYLKPNIKISGGDGTYENPYTIAIQ